MTNRVWAEIDLKEIENNFKKIKKITTSKVCCIIKDNAYGHGMIRLAKVYQELNADYLAVESIKEGIILRKKGIKIPILILGYTDKKDISLLYKYDLEQTIYNYQYALELDKMLAGKKIKVHIKIDTGMGRLGFIYRDNKDHMLNDVIKISKLSSFSFIGIYTHLAGADTNKEKDKNYSLLQYQRFNEAIKYLKNHNIFFKITHASNSGGILNYSFFRYDMVRPGILLYGIVPFKINNSIYNKEENFHSCLTLKSKIISIKEFQENDYIGYGSFYHLINNKKIGIVSIGYGDGIPRNLGNERYSLLIKNKEALIVGNICMDMLMVDVTNVNCKVNDEVIIYGNNKGHTINDVAKIAGTNPYELLCNINKRVKRIYKK